MFRKPAAAAFGTDPRSERAYVRASLLDYLISILVTGAFLAALLKHIGMTDSLIGILSAMVSLACVAQMAAGLLVHPKRRVKRWVSFRYLLNQLFFAALYCGPGIRMAPAAKSAVFCALLLCGHIVSNLVAPIKISWLLSRVDPARRGVFTAHMEIVSLLGGMVFTLVMGAVVDGCRAAGHVQLGFILCCASILVLAALHFWALQGAVEPEAERDAAPVPAQSARALFAIRGYRRVVLAEVLWRAALFLSTAYYGTYQLQELGFGMKYVSVLGVFYALIRAGVSRRFGRYADAHSWARLLTVCFFIAGLGFFLNGFTVPANGKVMFALHTVLYAMGMAGINGGLISITFDYVPYQDRARALGIKAALSGVAGFLASLAGGRVMDWVQGQGNQLYGRTVYAQQILSAASGLAMLLLAVFVLRGVVPLQRDVGQPRASETLEG